MFTSRATQGGGTRIQSKKNKYIKKKNPNINTQEKQECEIKEAEKKTLFFEPRVTTGAIQP